MKDRTGLRYGNVANPELLKQVLALGCETQASAGQNLWRLQRFRQRPIAVGGIKKRGTRRKFSSRRTAFLWWKKKFRESMGAGWSFTSPMA